MNYRTEFLTKARQEFLEAWAWYEDKQPGLGDRFREEVYSVIGILEKTPERYRPIAKSYRQAQVKIFPYLLIYRVHKKKKVIAVVSVFHTRRRPRKRFSRK